jgi:hypothetical protein
MSECTTDQRSTGSERMDSGTSSIRYQFFFPPILLTVYLTVFSRSDLEEYLLDRMETARHFF